MLQRLTTFLSSVVPSGGEALLMSIGGGFGAVVSFAFGTIDDAFLWLLAFISIDYVTGTAVALKTGEWCSSVGFVGLFKKFFILLIVSMCHGLDVATGTDLLRNVSIFAYGVNEFGSILENTERFGYGKIIPGVIRRGLKQLKNKEDELFSEEEEKKNESETSHN